MASEAFIVLDEAHNIEMTLEESVSFEFSKKEIDSIIKIF